MFLGNWYRKMIKLKELLNESINERVAMPFSQHLRTAQEEVEWMLAQGPKPDGDDSVYSNGAQAMKLLQVSQKALGKIK